MEQRGRKSAARLAIVRPDGVVSVPRLLPPDDMPEEQARLWVEVVSSKPADWFEAASAQILADFCRHTVSCRRLSAIIERLEAGDDLDIEQYTKLLRAREVESRASKALATAMRLTQQATYSARKSSRVVNTPRPWQE
jgi:hypothetical protein